MVNRIAQKEYFEEKAEHHRREHGLHYQAVNSILERPEDNIGFLDSFKIKHHLRLALKAKERTESFEDKAKAAEGGPKSLLCLFRDYISLRV